MTRLRIRFQATVILLAWVVLAGRLIAPAAAQERGQPSAYRAELNIPYCTVDGTTQMLNAFLPPLLICDGDRDPLVPGLQGRALQEKLQHAGADSTCWMTPGTGHEFPGGPGFDKLLEKFIARMLATNFP